MDVVKNLGLFLEIEMMNKSFFNPEKILEQFGLEKCRRIALGYTNFLLMKKEGYVEEDKISKYINDPDWNILINERMIINNIRKNIQ